MSARRVLIWVLGGLLVLALVVVGAGLLTRFGYGPGLGWFGFTGRGMMEGGRLYDMPRHFGMMPGYARGIGFPFIGWLGPILLFALGVGVGLLLGGIGRSPSRPEPDAGPSEAGVPASFEAWHNQLHERETGRAATKRARRS